jgi:hypothetical protein
MLTQFYETPLNIPQLAEFFAEEVAHGGTPAAQILYVYYTQVYFFVF